MKHYVKGAVITVILSEQETLDYFSPVTRNSVVLKAEKYTQEKMRQECCSEGSIWAEGGNFITNVYPE